MNPTKSQVYVFFCRGKKVFKGSLRAFFVDQRSEGGKADGFTSDEDCFQRSFLYKNYTHHKSYPTFNFSLEGQVRARDVSFKTFICSWAVGLVDEMTFKREGTGVRVTRGGLDIGLYSSWADVFVEFCKPKGYQVDMPLFTRYREGRATFSGIDVPASYPWCVGYEEAKERFNAREVKIKTDILAIKARHEAARPTDEVEEVGETDEEAVAPPTAVTPSSTTPPSSVAPPTSVAEAVLDVLKLHLANDPVALGLLEVYRLASK